MFPTGHRAGRPRSQTRCPRRRDPVQQARRPPPRQRPGRAPGRLGHPLQLLPQQRARRTTMTPRCRLAAWIAHRCCIFPTVSSSPLAFFPAHHFPRCMLLAASRPSTKFEQGVKRSMSLPGFVDWQAFKSDRFKPTAGRGAAERRLWRHDGAQPRGGRLEGAPRVYDLHPGQGVLH